MVAERAKHIATQMAEHFSSENSSGLGPFRYQHTSALDAAAVSLLRPALEAKQWKVETGTLRVGGSRRPPSTFTYVSLST